MFRLQAATFGTNVAWKTEMHKSCGRRERSGLNRAQSCSQVCETKHSDIKWFSFVFICLGLTVTSCFPFVWQMGYGFSRNASSFGPGSYIVRSHPFHVDILSVASMDRMELLHVQERTLASHESVRNFFHVTELDDYDPACHKDLTWDQVQDVSRFCRKRPKSLSYEFRFLRNMYARVQWLEKKPNPRGWLCAIQRPYAGLLKAYLHYKKNRQQLPDFFIILDDDSYYNLEIFQKVHQNLDSSQPTVVAGCLVRSPVHMINFTFPFGGFGAVFSKGALSYLFHPIICPDIENVNTTNAVLAIPNHPNYEGICTQLAKNVMLEQKYFKNGDSLLDLIYKYVNTERYQDVSTWTTGFCMHSDWVMGYFVNFYNVSLHVKEEYYKNVPHARIESFNGSEIYGSRVTGLCRNERRCPDGSAICHKPDIKWMEAEASSWKRENKTIES